MWSLLFKPGILLSILVVAIPAFLINRYLLRLIRPRESFKRFLLYMLTSLVVAFAYTWLGVFMLLKFVFPLNK